MPDVWTEIVVVVTALWVAIGLGQSLDEYRDRKAWEAHVEAHHCWQIDAHMWKCEVPTPTYWYHL